MQHEFTPLFFWKPSNDMLLCQSRVVILLCSLMEVSCAFHSSFYVHRSVAYSSIVHKLYTPSTFLP